MQPAKQPQAPSEPGPFRADQIREGDPYELSNGHPIRCMSAGDRHGDANRSGATVLGTDPAVERAGVDVGFTFNEGKNLRAPDISVGNLKGQPGWAKEPPPLAVEYADRGQDEEELQAKIGELLHQGTRFIWVVRLTGPLRVEVYEPGKGVRIVDGEGTLTAPSVLQNPVPVRALVDPEASNEATLRNLLNRKGYQSLEDLRAKEQARGRQDGEAKGRAEGQARAILTVLEARGLPISEDIRARILACTDLATLTRWLMRAALAPSAADAIAD